jgi:hypothetical protein
MKLTDNFIPFCVKGIGEAFNCRTSLKLAEAFVFKIHRFSLMRGNGRERVDDGDSNFGR